jgi:hypothetical protein
MKLRDVEPQEQELPSTVYALKIGTPPVAVAIAVDLQTAELIKSSSLPTATIVAGTLVDK